LNVRADEIFSITIGPESTNPDIETAGTGALRLTLRLYKPGAALQRNPATLKAPTIELAEVCP
jgi:hypothetical protein